MLLALGTPLLGMLMSLFMGKEVDNESLVGMAVVPIILGVTLFVLLRMKTEVILHTDKVTFRSNAFMSKYKDIKLNELSSWWVTDHKWINGLGYRRSLNGDRVYVMSPGKALVITTKAGRKYRFGINRPEVVKRFIAENWEEKNKVYG